MVSIIIPCYNQGHFLADAIESALNQTHKNIEVIVIDDGSTDNTREIAKKYRNVRYIWQKNKHLSGARNTGIKEANGEWILPLDADDKINPEMVKKCLKMADKDDLDIISTWLETFGNENRRWGSLNLRPTWQNFIQNNQINCCSLFRREMWEKLGGYDENMKEGFEDWDFWRRATKKGYKVGILNEFLFYYRKHGTSMFAEAQKKRQRLIEYMRVRESAAGQLIDIVYPLGKGSINGDNELKFSLRSVEKHLTGWRDIWIIGEFPRWGNHLLKHVPAIDKHDSALNILEKIKIACETPGISDYFLFMNDDHIFRQDSDAVMYDYYFSQDDLKKYLETRPSVDYYVELIKDTLRFDSEMLFYDIHKPMVINKQAFLDMYDTVYFHSFKRGLLVKSMYCHVNKIIGTPKPDCILRTKEDGQNVANLVQNSDVFSFTDDAICKEFIQYMDKNYPIKSQFEN